MHAHQSQRNVRNVHVLMAYMFYTHIIQVSAAREEVPGRRGFPGYMYTDLATIYEVSTMCVCVCVCVCARAWVCVSACTRTCACVLYNIYIYIYCACLCLCE